MHKSFLFALLLVSCAQVGEDGLDELTTPLASSSSLHVWRSSPLFTCITPGVGTLVLAPCQGDAQQIWEPIVDRIRMAGTNLCWQAEPSGVVHLATCSKALSQKFVIERPSPSAYLFKSTATGTARCLEADEPDRVYMTPCNGSGALYWFDWDAPPPPPSLDAGSPSGDAGSPSGDAG